MSSLDHTPFGPTKPFELRDHAGTIAAFPYAPDALRAARQRWASWREGRLAGTPQTRLPSAVVQVDDGHGEELVATYPFRASRARGRGR